MNEGLGWFVAWIVQEILGRLIGRFSRKIDRLPDRNFSECSTLAKFGRLTMCAGVLVFLLGPILWLVLR